MASGIGEMIFAWITKKLAGLAFGRFVSQAGPYIFPAIVMIIMAVFTWFQSGQIKDMAAQIEALETELSTCEANVAAVLRDKLRDDEIDDLSNSDLVDRAVSSGWLRPSEADTETDGSSLLPD